MAPVAKLITPSRICFIGIMHQGLSKDNKLGAQLGAENKKTALGAVLWVYP